MELLQIGVSQGDKIVASVLQYGILGIVAIALAYFAYHQYSRLIKKNDELEKKIDKLQSEMMQLLVDERERMAELVKQNTTALKELHQTIMTYLLTDASKNH